jgi:hypothetical protein
VIDTDGTYLVGTDISPGTYRTAGSPSCYWARLSSLSTNDIIDNNNSNGPQVIEIQSSDKAFLTERCATWSLISAARAPTAAAMPTVSTTRTLPDADSQGFLNYQGGGRCHTSDQAALIVRTAQSAVVICQSGSSAYYYRGVRLSDDGMIELPATPTGTGFTATSMSVFTDTAAAQVRNRSCMIMILPPIVGNI